MTHHILLPQRMVNPLLAQLANPVAKNVNIHLWIYDGDPDIMRKETDTYRAFRKDMQETDASINFPDIEDVSYVMKEENIEKLTPGFNDYLFRASEINKKNFKSNIEAGDKVIIIGDGELWTGVAYTLLKEKGSQISMELILDYEKDEVATLENALLLEGKENVRIDFVRQERGYDLVATGIALVSVLEKLPEGVYVQRGGSKDVLYLTDREMDLKTLAMSIANIKQLESNLNVASGSEKFRKKTKVEGGFEEYLKNINAYLKNVEDYLFSIRTIYRPDFRPSDMTGKINKMSNSANGLSSKFYCQSALKEILKLSLSEVTGFSLKGEKTAIKKLISEEASPLIDFSEIINPFLSAKETKDAFSREDERARKLRSACLDIWERIFENILDKVRYDSEKKDYVKVEELTKKADKESWRLYEGLPYSDETMTQAAIFNVETVEMETYEVIKQIQAFTTPATGFAVSIKKGYTGKELNERDKEFKQFIYDYVKVIGGFSQEFKNYVSDNCSTEDLSAEEKSFFEKYPLFSQHIPVY